MSKNNFDERLRKMEPRKDHYSIRKFSVGVASVLIGFSFLGLGNTREVKAGTIDQPQAVETKKSISDWQKQTVQDNQNKADQGSLSTDNESQKVLTGVQAAAIQAMKNRQAAAIARKSNKSLEISDSTNKLNSDIGLTGRKDTDSKSQNVEKQSEKNSASVSKNTNTAEKTAVKSDSKSGQVVNKKLTDSEENQSDTQMLTIKTSDIKSGKTDQADDLAKELTTDLTENESGNKLNIKGVDGKLASGTEQTLDVNKTAGQDTKNNKNQANAKKLARLYGNNLDEIKSKDVSDWAGLSEAMNDSSVGEIDFTKDISINGTISGVRQPNPSVNSHKLQLTGKNIARTLIINGNGHLLNFGDYYLSFDENNQSNGIPWNLTIENVTINAKGYSSGTYAGAFSPFYMGKDDFGGDNLWNKKSYLAKNKVTFDNVTADIKNGAFYTTTMAQQISDEPYTTVTFKGKNNITCEAVNADSSQVNNYSSAVSASHIIFADGTTNFFVSTKKTNNDTNAGGNILRAKVEDSKDTEAPIIIEEGATVNLNVPTKDVLASDIHATDVRGILVNNALKGTVVVNGTLNADMQKGHSTAIWAGSLEIGKNGTVDINTQQDNKSDGDWGHGVYNYNSVHFAPISLGVGFAANVTASASHLTDDGTLIIKRDNTGKTLTPLIAFGSGGVNPVKYNMTVGDGATLDLKDNSTTFDSVLSDTKQANTPPAGMITMFGTSSKDSFMLDNPGYVNFERNNQDSSLRGNFIRLEGTTNATWLNGPSSSNAVTPIAQWDAGDFDSPSFVWYVKQLHTQNQWGNYANSYTSKKNPTANKGVDAILDATDNLFIMAPNQAGQGSTSVTNGEVNTTGDTGVGYKTDYVNQFGNHFSWWLPQRLALGSKLEQHNIVVNDADKYQPEVQTIETDTTHKLGGLNVKDAVTVKDGITDLIGPDGRIPYDGKIDWTKTHWYNATEDGTNWTKIMGSKQSPVAASVNTDGTLKEGTTSNTATVVYTDGSIDFVNIPIKVTAPSDSTLYNAHYQGATVEQGQTGTIAKPSITKKADGSVAPNTVTETYKRTSDTPSWVTVKNDGSLSLAPTIKNSTTGMYNVPVLVTYNDNSSETVYAPVYVTNDDNHHVIWGKDGRSAVIVVTQPVTLHETSDNSMVTTSYAGQAVKGFDIYTKDTSNPDKVNTTVDAYTYKNGQYQDAGGQNLGSITVSWASDPTTTVTTPTLDASKSAQLKITFNAGSAPVVDGISDAGETDTVNAPLSLMGAEKIDNSSVDVVRGQQPTSDQLAQLVDHSKLDGLSDGMAVVKYELKPGTTLDTSTKGKKSVSIRILFKDKDAQGNQTYLDLPAISNGINVVDSDADTYDAHYQGMTIKQGSTGTIAKPSVTKKADGSVASNTVIKTYKSTSDTPIWVKVNTDGSLSLTPTTNNSTVGMYNVPILVTYNDNSTETVYAPVYVTKDDVHHVTWGKDGHSAVVTVTQPVTLHQTSDSSMVTTDYAGQAVKEFDVYTKDATNPDKISTTAHAYTSKDGQYQDAAGQKLGSIAVAWNGDPSTVVATPSLTSSKTAEIKITFGAGSVPVSDGIFDADKSDTANVSLDLMGATEKTGYTPVDVVRGQQPTSDQLASLVDHSKLNDLPDGIKVDHYELVGTLDTSTTGKKDVTIRIVFKDKNSSSKETYLDLPAITNGINVIASEADKYIPSYSRITLRPGQTVSIIPSWKDSKTPSGESFALVTGDNTPTWATINSSNGEITFAPTANVNDSAYRVPVKVTYQDGSYATVYAPVYVTDGQHTATWGEGMTTMYEGPVATYHKTTNGNDLDIKNSRLVNIYNWDEDNNETIWTLTSTPEGDYYIENKGNHSSSRFAASDITYTWITNLKGVTEPSTNVNAFDGDTGSLLYLNSDGTVNKKEQTGPDEDSYGNSKWRYHFTIGGDAPSDIDVPAGMWANIYFNFLGATGKTGIPVNVGDTVPTDANGIKKYLQSTDVINPPASGQSYGAIHKDWTVTNISWETNGTNGKPGSNGKFDANNLNGTVRLDFKNANGNTSYLDVKVSFETGSYVPHNNSNDNKNDDTNLYVTRTVHYDVPAGETAVPDVIQPVHYIRDGHHKVDSQGNDLPDIVWNDWKLAEGQTAKFPEIETVKQFTGYDSYINKEKGKTVAATDVTEDKDKTPQDGKEVTVTYVKQNATPIKYDPNSTDDNMTVHRHITYDVSGTGHTAIDSVDQTVDYVRKDADGNAGYKDPVTGKITYVAWTVKNGGSASFPEINPVVQITGYDSYVGGTKTTTLASADIAEDKDGKPQNADNITITYKASDQSVKFEFWDDTDNKEIGSDHTVKGTTNQTVTTNLTAPANYDLAKGNGSETDLYSIPASYKFGASNPAVIKIHFVHGTETITHDKPSTTIKGAEASDLTTKVTRKVTINTPATNGQEAKSDVKNQEVDFGRSVKVDKVTGKIISYSDWQVISSNSTLVEVDAPTVAGYTPTVNKADEVTPKAGDKVADVTINYNANDQSSYYKFVDDENHGNQVGNNHIIEGTTGQTIDLNINAPEHYVLVPDQTIPTKYTFKAGANNPLTIHLQHKVDTIDPNKSTNPDKIPAGAKNSDGSDVTKDNFSETIKRTITAHIPATAGSAAHDQDLSETTTIHRTGNYDEVTKTMTYNTWSTGKFDEVDAPEVAGYKPSQKTIGAVTDVTDGYKDPNISITYSAGSESVNFNWVDDDENGAKVGSSISLSGDTDKSVNTGLSIPDGYELAGGKSDTATDIYNNIPSSYTFKDSNPDINIHLKHKIDKGVTGDTVKPGTKTPDGKKDISKDDFSETIKRTITAVEPDHNGGTVNKDLSQTITLTRTGDVDEVTKKITWNAWSTGKFDAVTAPAIDGYKPSEDTVPAVATVSDGYIDPNVKITYTANKQNIDYQFVDDDKKNAQGNPTNVGSAIEVDGHTDDTVEPNQKVKVPSGYELAEGQTIPNSVKLSADNKDLGKTIDIHLKHKVDTIDPNKPTNPDKIPSDAKNSDGSSVTTANFSEDVKRKITAEEPSGNVDLSQTVTIYRTGKYDEVTKTMTYNDWVPGTFKAVDAPAVAGYTPSQGSVAAEAATDGFNKTYTITYTANGQKMVYTYWDDTDNKKIPSTETDGNYTISGKTGDNVSTGLVTPTGYQLAVGQTLPTSYTFTSAKEQTATIHFVHKIDKGISKDQNPSDSQTSAADFSEDVKRTIIAEEPTGDVDLSQTTTITRTGDYDEVTKKIIKWNPWTTGSFSAVNAPVVEGYTASQDSVQAVTSIGPDYKDPNVIITYTLKSITQQISYQFVDDENSGANVGNAISISGLTGHTIDLSNKLSIPVGYQLARGTDSATDLYDIPTSVRLSADNKELGKTVKIHLDHKTITVQPGDLPNKGDKKSGDNGHKIPGDGKPINDIFYTDLHKDITRTITVNTPNATPTVITQAVSYERNATIDDVTGNVTYGDWTVDPASKEQSLAEYDVPSVTGYAPSQNKVEAETPTSKEVDSWSDPKIVITYTKLSNGNPGGNDQPTPPTPQGQIIIKYVDPNGKTVHTVTVPVAKGSTTDPSGVIKSNVPKGYKLPDGYTAPTSASDGSTISVSVVPNQNSTSNPGHGNHKPTHNNKPSRKGKIRQTNAPKHNAKSGSNSAPLSERGPRGLSGHNLAALEAEKGIGQNGVKTVKVSGQNGSHNANTLPQTGENDHRAKIMSTIGFLGLTAAGIIALLTLGGDRKRK